MIATNYMISYFGFCNKKTHARKIYGVKDCKILKSFKKHLEFYKEKHYISVVALSNIMLGHFLLWCISL